jgi:hypothetical protein
MALQSFGKKYAVDHKLSPWEKSVTNNPNPDQNSIVSANWRAESYHVMLWALGYVDALSYPSDICNIGEDVGILFSRSEDEFRQQARLRSKEEIVDQADLILRYSWACTSARVGGREMPGNLNGSVVYERHYALNWLINYYDQDWDDVSTNT